MNDLNMLLSCSGTTMSALRSHSDVHEGPLISEFEDIEIVCSPKRERCVNELIELELSLAVQWKMESKENLAFVDVE